MNREERACGARNHNSAWGEKAGYGFGLGTESGPCSADVVAKLPFLNELVGGLVCCCSRCFWDPDRIQQKIQLVVNAFREERNILSNFLVPLCAFNTEKMEENQKKNI